MKRRRTPTAGSDRGPYRQPRLQKFGDVTELTLAAGITGMTDNGMVAGMTKTGT